MSNEENAKNTEENVSSVEESVKNIEESVSNAAEKVENTANAAADSAKSAVGNIISSVMGLKESNPKLFYGLLAIVAIPLVVVMMSGGGSDTVTGPKIKDLVSGQKYVLKSSNSYDPSATVRLVAVPGALAAYDDSEESDRNGACQHLAQNTPVTALDFSPAYGQAKAFVKVQVEDGPCKGTTAWALGIDVQ